MDKLWHQSLEGVYSCHELETVQCITWNGDPHLVILRHCVILYKMILIREATNAPLPT